MILDGKSTAEKLFGTLKSEINSDSKTLWILKVGKNPASELYIKMKIRKASEINIDVKVEELDEQCEEELVVKTIEAANKNDTIGGILIQLPLPEHLDEQKILDTVIPEKDIDGLSSQSRGLFKTSRTNILTAAPRGILLLMQEYEIPVQGIEFCIVGSGKLIGGPLSDALIQMGATVTVCNEFTPDLKVHTKHAHVIVTATGKPHLFDQSYFRDDCTQIIIDAGTSAHPETGKIVGDVDFEAVHKFVHYITPVPGGVGPMTIYALIENFVRLSAI